MLADSWESLKVWNFAMRSMGKLLPVIHVHPTIIFKHFNIGTRRLIINLQFTGRQSSPRKVISQIFGRGVSLMPQIYDPFL